MQQLLHVHGIFSLDQNEKNEYLHHNFSTAKKVIRFFFKDTPIQTSKRRIFCFAVHTMYILPIFHYKFTQPRQSLRLYRTNFRKQRLNCKK
jgi:dipeptide/tripeptide permease